MHQQQAPVPQAPVAQAPAQDQSGDTSKGVATDAEATNLADGMSRISLNFLINPISEEEKKREEAKKTAMTFRELHPIRELPSPKLEIPSANELNPSFSSPQQRDNKGKRPDYDYQPVSPLSPYACQPSPPMSHNSSPVAMVQQMHGPVSVGQNSAVVFATAVHPPKENYSFGHLPQDPNQTHPVPATYYNQDVPEKHTSGSYNKRNRSPAMRWQPEEDELLKKAVEKWGDERQWVKVAKMVPERSNLQCRQRWLCNLKGKMMAAKLKAEAAEKDAALLAVAAVTGAASSVASTSAIQANVAEILAAQGAILAAQAVEAAKQTEQAKPVEEDAEME
ncbi:hypothetical protein FBU59_003956 [Linderina macrospora]|uniref:Uncharacterized protein n=1 Tax=Linderina macrospora TaxID=4868 RepID=A0ACC1J6W5_9FUNG|nr:hypothetical protein FBU59_003956 [Linderina macrospora]